MAKFGSDWLPPYGKKIPAGLVVKYVTHDEHRDRHGNVYPRGTPCRALRSPSGELCLLFWNLDRAFEMVAVWPPPGAGLCGVEPNVCDPLLENQAYVNLVIAGVDARVMHEIRQDCEKEARERGEREDSILETGTARVADDLDGGIVEALESLQKVLADEKTGTRVPVERDDEEH